MITFQKISNIFSEVLANNTAGVDGIDELGKLVKACIEINKKLWNLEDISRMRELGAESVATAKNQIDINNQTRNELIQKMDLEIEKILGNKASSLNEKFYAESPGMVIDRLAILFIKKSVIGELLPLIKETDLKQDYIDNENVISKQISDTGNFLDFYFTRIKQGEVFFSVQQPVKIYNDKRIKKYIKPQK